MKLITLIVVTLLPSACVLAQSDTDKAERNELDKVRPSKEGPWNKPTEEGSKGPTHLQRPPPMRCRPVTGTCASQCTKNGEVCKDGKCCSREDHGDGSTSDKDPIQSLGKCLSFNGTCGDTCKQKGGYCMNGKCCFKSTKGMKDRCTKRACSNKKEISFCEARNGYCSLEKCCFKPTKNEAQSRCENQKMRQSAESKTSGNMDVEVIKCNIRGAFLASCKMNKTECRCLNATSGKPVGDIKSVHSSYRIDCDEVQKQTEAENLTITTKVSSIPYSRFNETHREQMMSQVKPQIEATVPVQITEIRVYKGSVMMDITFGRCYDNCAATANTTDVYSLGNKIVEQIKQGAIEIKINGKKMVLSDPGITHITTTAALEAMEQDMKKSLVKEDTETSFAVIIAVVVVVVVVVVVSVGTACYCYKRANKLKAVQEYLKDVKRKSASAQGKDTDPVCYTA